MRRHSFSGFPCAEKEGTRKGLNLTRLPIELQERVIDRIRSAFTRLGVRQTNRSLRKLVAKHSLLPRSLRRVTILYGKSKQQPEYADIEALDGLDVSIAFEMDQDGEFATFSGDTLTLLRCTQARKRIQISAVESIYSLFQAIRHTRHLQIIKQTGKMPVKFYNDFGIGYVDQTVFDARRLSLTSIMSGLEQINRLDINGVSLEIFRFLLHTHPAIRGFGIVMPGRLLRIIRKLSTPVENSIADGRYHCSYVNGKPGFGITCREEATFQGLMLHYWREGQDLKSISCLGRGLDWADRLYHWTNCLLENGSHEWTKIMRPPNMDLPKFDNYSVGLCYLNTAFYERPAVIDGKRVFYRLLAAQMTSPQLQINHKRKYLIILDLSIHEKPQADSTLSSEFEPGNRKII